MTTPIFSHSKVVGVLDRIHARKALQHLGVIGESTRPLSSDTPEVAQLLAESSFAEGVRELADRLGRDYDSVLTEAAGYVREMAATHDATASDAWSKFGDWLLRAYDLFVDEEAVAKLRKLDRKHALVFLPSHRSYLDTWVMPNVLAARGIAPLFGFGGANLNFFPFGTIASRTGIIFIRRATSEIPVYRFALRSFVGQLIRDHANFGWSIEGGRTRTGKLRPPVYGILRYLVDGVESTDGNEVYLVPMSIVYDQLHEVEKMTAEAKGGRKRPEDVRWLIEFARAQRTRLGRAYFDFAEPIPLRARLAELRADQGAAPRAVERVALDVCHRINRVTPVTATAIVSLALLGADRSLTLAEVSSTVRPLAEYVQGRNWPVAGAATPAERSAIRHTLQELVNSGVLSCYEGGHETVWGIAAGKHLVAAFYRNTAIHILVDRAISEVALLATAESTGDRRIAVREEALRLRELLKFDFFFSGRSEFGAELAAELRLLDVQAEEKTEVDPMDLRLRLAQARPHVAHLVLRPFLDAYHVVADGLVRWEDEFDERRFLAECLKVGQQWALQRKVASDESVSLELFKTGLRLAEHRGLLEETTPMLDKRRREFAAEIAASLRLVQVIAEMAQAEDAFI